MKLRKIGNLSEKKAAKKVGAKVVKGSGSMWYNKGDYETDRFVYQNKFTGIGSYSLKLSELRKAEKDALTKNKDFIFSIELSGVFYYIFKRVLINETQEDTLNLERLQINKSVKLNDINDNYLINNNYILVHEYDFRRLGIK